MKKKNKVKCVNIIQQEYKILCIERIVMEKFQKQYDFIQTHPTKAKIDFKQITFEMSKQKPKRKESLQNVIRELSVEKVTNKEIYLFKILLQ